MKNNKDKNYWETRAKQYGFLSAGYTNEDQFYHEEKLREYAFNRIFKIKTPHQSPFEKGRGTHLNDGSRGICKDSQMKVLDIGAGVGKWARYIADKGVFVTGIDISEEMVKIAKEQSVTYENIDYSVCPVEEASFSDESYDLILSITVLQHLTDNVKFEKAINNIIRMVKKEGHIIILEYSPKIAPKNFNSDYMVSRTYEKWSNIFDKNKCSLIKERGVRFIGFKLHNKYRYAKEIFLNNKIPIMLRPLDKLVTKTILSVSKIIDMVLSEFKFMSKFSDLHIYLFKRL